MRVSLCRPVELAQQVMDSATIDKRRHTILLIGRNKVSALIEAHFQAKPFDIIGWDAYDANETADPPPNLRGLEQLVSRVAQIDGVAIGGGIADHHRQEVAAMCQALCPTAKVVLRSMQPGEREEFVEIMRRGDPEEIAAAKRAGKGPTGMVMFVEQLVQSLDSA